MSSLTAWLLCAGSQCGSSGKAGVTFLPRRAQGESLCKLCLLVGYVFICLWFPSSWVSWIWANPEISKQNTTETPSGFTSKQHFPGNPLPELESPLQPATAHCHWHQHKVAGLVVFSPTNPLQIYKNTRQKASFLLLGRTNSTTMSNL